jgi:hypothetical protein
MKKKVTALAVLTTLFFVGFAQQVPNGSFENWTNEYTCTSWTGVEVLLQNLIPWQASFFTFKDTTTFTDGTASIKIMADTIPGAPAFGVVPGVASLGIGLLAGTSPSFTGIPFIYRPDSVIFDYQFTTPGVDSGGASLSLTYKGIPLVEVPGRPALQTKLAPDSSWVHFAIAMAPYYIDNIYPDSLLIQFVASTQSSTVFGSTLHVDNVRFGYVNQPLSVTTHGSTTFCLGDSVALTAHTGESSGYGYQWNLAGAPLTGATGAIYSAKVAGTYTVTIDSAGVTSTSQSIVVTDTNCATGISYLTATHLSVYPNPATTQLNITSNTSLAGFNLEMFDLLGRVVRSEVLEASANAINISKLAEGTYIYRVTDKENQVVSQNKITVIK